PVTQAYADQIGADAYAADAASAADQARELIDQLSA
ncbi:MAG: cobalamin-binding protein, partial [Candidatus Latescibacteria bacterium]|nr:cobalamin-binding protein [Candidatus Latescibacterota bacterium]